MKIFTIIKTTSVRARNIVTTGDKTKYFYWGLAVLVALNTLRFTVASFTSHTSFNTFGFDLGIIHHATWLISRLEDPFSTVNGLHFFAGHARFISVLTAPLVWLWEDARLLLLLQALMLSLGAIPIFLIAKEKLGSNLIGAAIVLCYLLYPALGHLNLENFHYNSFLTTFFLYAFYFLIRGNYTRYFIFIFLALITKEEAIATVLMLGVYAVFQNKKVGFGTLAVTLIYMLVLLKIVFPVFNPEGYSFYSRLQVVGVFFSDPFSLSTYPEIWSIVKKNLFTQVNGAYLWQMLYPIGLLPLLSPATLLLSGSLYINLLSDWSYTHSIRYHYVSAVIPFIFISVIYGLALLRTSAAKRWLPYIVIGLVASSVVGNEVHGPNKTKLSSLKGFSRNLERSTFVDTRFHDVAQLIPDDATVSAVYNLVPHLSARKVIFQYPNPFVKAYWGLSRNAPYTDIKFVDYVIRDMRRDKEYEPFTKLVEAGTYVVKKSEGPFVLYKYTGS